MSTEEKTQTENEMDVNKLLEERARLDKMFSEQFQKIITVMFTDLKGSTSIAETQGDVATRAMLKHHNDIVTPAVTENNGILVKTMGDGTMSYFIKAQDALRAAVRIQKGIDQFNMDKIIALPIYIRIGLHTGKGIVEHNDIFGDVVNVASRFESAANPGEIYLSEATYNALEDKSEIYCRFLKKTTLKGKANEFDVYKAFWNPSEIEEDIVAKPMSDNAGESGMSGVTKAALIIIPILIVAAVLIAKSGLLKSGGENKRAIEHQVTIPLK